MPRTAITIPRLVSRFMGGSTLFNGSTSKIVMTADTIVPVTGVTLDCWVNQTTTGTALRVLNLHNSCSLNINNGTARFTLYGVWDGTATYKLPTGKWVKLTATYDRVSAKVYVNGVLATTDAKTDAFPTGTITPGIGHYNGGSFFSGKIAEAKFYTQALTASQALELYTTGSVSGVSPVASYALDDLPSTYIDSIGGNNGTGTATTYSPDTPVQQRVVVSDDKASAIGSAMSAVGTVDTVTSLAGTVIGMAKVSVYNGNTICCFYASDEVTDAWRFNIESGTGYPFIWTVNTAGSGATNPKPSIPVPKNQWFHFAIVQTISGGVVTGKIYINGQLIGIGTRASDVRSCSRFAIIENSVAKTMAVAVYERELTPTEIRNHCFGRIIDGIPVGHVIPTGAKINWPRQEGAGNINYDASGNGSNGTGGTLTWSSDTPSKAREAVGGNLVKNGDFSYVPVVNVPTTTSGRWVDGTAGGSTTNKLFGWAVANGSASSFSVNFDSTVGRTSPGSLKLSMLDATGAPNVSINVNVSSGTSKADGIWEVLPNTSYTFNAWVLTNNVGTNDCYCDIREFNSVATAITTTSTNKLSGTSSSWQLLTLTFTTSPTTRFVLPIFRLGQGSDNISSYNIDDISFSKTIPDTRTTV